MAATWLLLAPAVVNGQGNLFILSVRVVSEVGQDWTGSAINERTTTFERDLFGAVGGWRFESGTGRLRPKGNDLPENDIQRIALFDVQAPTYDAGSDTSTVEFKVCVLLGDGVRIAINNAQDTVRMDGLKVSGGRHWMTLKWKGGTPGQMPADAILTDANLTADTSAVGKLPNPGSALVLSVDAHAEAVARGNPTQAVLAAAQDLTGIPDNDLVGEPITSVDDRRPVLRAGGVPPRIDFPAPSPPPSRFRSDTTTPLITSPCTVAVVLRPSTSQVRHVVGRFQGGAGADPSWRIFYNANSNQVGYESVGQGGADAAGFNAAGFGETFLFILSREEDNSYRAWLNGVLVGEGEFDHDVNEGDGPLSIAARPKTDDSWDQGFFRAVNQVGLYDDALDDLALSLLMHQMADRAVIALGTPIPGNFQSQPYHPESYPDLPERRGLLRRPMAVIQLAPGTRDNNIFGQSETWRNKDTGAPNVEALKDIIRKAINACDQFEIVFNRPGGSYFADHVVMSYVFGTAYNGTDVITEDMWAGMRELWDFFNLSDANDDQNRSANNYTQRRGWFYVGSGLPLHDDGTLDESGLMHSRQVAPATPTIYKSAILDHWLEHDDEVEDPRFRCFFLDNAISFFGKFVELVHHSEIYENFTLIAESIPEYNLDNEAIGAENRAARLGAPWFGMAGLPSGQWWKPLSSDDIPQGKDLPDKRAGYNWQWATDPVLMPVYFGVQRDNGGATLDLHAVKPTIGPAKVGEGNDLLLGDIYRLAVRGAIPMAWFTDTYQKVGAAWNYATGRVLPSRQFRSPRLNRRARV